MRRRSHHQKHDRDTSDISLDQDLGLDRDLKPSSPIRPFASRPILDDRRRWAPALAPREVSGRHARVVYKASRGGALTHKKTSTKNRFGVVGKPIKPQVYKYRSLAERPSFKDARHTSICIKRKNRREVIFAKKLAGRGARSKKHFNPFSQIRC